MLVEEINEGIKEAMKSKNTLRLSVLRMLKSKILNVDARGNLEDKEVIKIFKTYLGNLEEAFEQAALAGRKEMSDQLKEEISVVQEFLPKMLSQEETLKLVKAAISESGARTKKDVGLVMKSVMKQGQNVDGKIVKECVDQLLSE